MHLIPTNEEVIALLRDTGALRNGHFEYPNGTHTDEFLQVALAFRYFQNAKLLSVGLSPAAKVLELKGRLRCRGCGRWARGGFDRVAGQGG